MRRIIIYYKLNDNVYFVDGAVKSCIYDLNNLKVYSINKELKNFFCDKLFTGHVGKLTPEEKDIINYTLNASLLVETEYPVQPRTIENDLSEEPKITFAWIELTKGCNLECIHCYENSSPYKKDIMLYEDYQKVVSILKDIGVRNIQFIGGEPLLLKNNLEKYLRLARESFNEIELFTNGTLITPVVANLFKELNISVALSVYSYNEGEHNKVTQNMSSHKMTMRGIQILKENNVLYRIANLRIKGIDLGENNTDLFDLNFKNKTVVVTGRAKLNLFDEKLLKRKLITKESFKAKLSIERIKRAISGHNCFSNRLYIDTELNSYPCVMERRIHHGNLRNNCPDTIINSSIIQLTKNKIEGCKLCEYRIMCLDCRPDSLSKNVYEKPWYCTYSPERGEWQNINTFINKLGAINVTD